MNFILICILFVKLSNDNLTNSQLLSVSFQPKKKESHSLPRNFSIFRLVQTDFYLDYKL